MIRFTLWLPGGLYTEFQELSQFADSIGWQTGMDWEFDEEPLSASNVSLRLAEIQKRCTDLMTEPDGLDDLKLEGDETSPGDDGGFNPYNHT